MTPFTNSQLVELVNEAYKSYASILALSRSPLAISSLVTPVLVLDPLTPTPEERGRALQLLLRWALEKLAPDAIRHPLGTFRPWDDPTWRDPAWWRYTILRHRYVEPLHPEDFVEGGRFTETLMALTGIATPDAFYSERSHAMRAAAAILQEQMETNHAADELQQRALSLVCAPLVRQPEMGALLGIATVLEGVFPRTLLMTLATAENLRSPADGIDELIEARFILTGDEGASLWLSPTLRSYLYHREDPARLRIRHARAAAYYAEQHDHLSAARHWRLAGQWRTAADLLLAAAVELTEDLQRAALRAELTACSSGALDDERWRRIQLLLSDICAAEGDNGAAIEACRAALKRTQSPADQGVIFWRIGKLYEMRNQRHALNYYRQAEERLTADAGQLVLLLKDRAWLYIHRRAWAEAASDLNRALTLAAPGQGSLRAEVLDALAALHRYQHELDAAIDCAQQALALREQCGDLLGVAKSLGNLGLLYTATGDHAQAVAAHHEALDASQRTGNRELSATAMLNIGLAHHMAGELAQAVPFYRQSLTLSRTINYRLVELRSLSNLAEALAEVGEPGAAQSYWRSALELARQDGFDDETAYLLELAERYNFADERKPLLTSMPAPEPVGSGDSAWSVVDLLDAEDRLALTLAQNEGKVTPRRLMEAGALSKATATRRLTALAAAGLLVQVGQGRATSYMVAASSQQSIPTAPRPPLAFDRDLMQRYTITAAGWLGDAQVVVLRFAHLPDLLTFLALRAEVRQRLGDAIDVLPEEAVSTGQNVIWNSP